MEAYKQLINTVDLQKKVDSGYELNIKSILSQTFAHFKKDVGMYVLLFLIFFTLLVASAITIVGPLLIVYPLMVGFTYAALQADLGEKMVVKDLFKGFEKFVPLFLLMLILLACMSVIFIPFYFIMWQSGMFNPEAMARGAELPAMFWWWYLFVIIISVVINASLFFAPFLIFYGDFSPMAAVRTSWDLAKQKLPKLILLHFTLSLISILGIVIFGFGILLSIPLAYVGYYILIKNVLFSKK